MVEVTVMGKNYVVEDLQELYDYKSFEEFEKYADSLNHNLIFYADGQIESVLKALKDEWGTAKYLVNKIVLFDDWYIALAEL